MLTLHYGVVRQSDAWMIIGEGLRFGAYPSRAAAEAAARRLAMTACGLPVDLHIQDETGELRPPTRLP